jgi:hypothetical protein
MRQPVTFDLPERKVFSMVEGENPPEPHTVTVRNTSGAGFDELKLIISGRSPEAFVIDKTAISDFAHGGQETFAVTAAEGLTAGTYEAVVEIVSGTEILNTFPVYITVSAPGVYDYLTLLPNNAWRVHTGDTVVEIGNGPDNQYGVPSLVFTNTAGRWPAATGELAWGTGVRIDRSDWDRVFLEYDVTVRDHANINMLSGGPSLPQHRVPVSHAMAANNTLNEGGLSGDDLRRGRYLGRVSLAEIMRIRGEIASEYEFLMPRMEAFYFEGWRVFAIGATPATVAVDVFRLVKE